MGVYLSQAAVDLVENRSRVTAQSDQAKQLEKSTTILVASHGFLFVSDLT